MRFHSKIIDHPTDCSNVFHRLHQATACTGCSSIFQPVVTQHKTTNPSRCLPLNTSGWFFSFDWRTLKSDFYWTLFFRVISLRQANTRQHYIIDVVPDCIQCKIHCGLHASFDVIYLSQSLFVAHIYLFSLRRQTSDGHSNASLSELGNTMVIKTSKSDPDEAPNPRTQRSIRFGVRKPFLVKHWSLN